jgi:hypothetical protein
MKASDLENLGFYEVDENEYSNDDYTIFILSDEQLSIIGEKDDNFLSVPTLNCSTSEDLINFFKLVGYDIQNKD